MHISYVFCIGRWVLYHECCLGSPCNLIEKGDLKTETGTQGTHVKKRKSPSSQGERPGTNSLSQPQKESFLQTPSSWTFQPSELRDDDFLLPKSQAVVLCYSSPSKHIHWAYWGREDLWSYNSRTQYSVFLHPTSIFLLLVCDSFLEIGKCIDSQGVPMPTNLGSLGWFPQIT